VTGLAVGEAGPNDLPDLLALMQQLNPDDPPLEPETAKEIAGHLFANAITTILLGRYEGRATASCALLIVPNLTRGGRPYALVENVVTDAASRGRGFGKAIMGAAVERARKAGCYKVILTTGRRDERVWRFYESCGFDRTTKAGFQLRFQD
jgi:GNAT superfamily N-acetyltransferase